MKIDPITFVEAFCNRCDEASPLCENYKTICKYNPDASGLRVLEASKYSREETPSFVKGVRVEHEKSRMKIFTDSNVLTIVDSGDVLERVKIDGAEWLTRVDRDCRRKFVAQI
jgi:hypothetical protein